MGSSVGFSSAGRPCSIPVNARPFAAYEPLLKSGSARTILGLILADNPGGFQGAAEKPAGFSFRRQSHG